MHESKGKDEQKNFKNNAASGTPCSHTPSERIAQSALPETAASPQNFESISLHRGYIQLWRKIEDSAIFRDSHAFHLFTYLLVKAQYQDEKYSCTFKGQQIYLQRGQVITGRYELSKAINLPPSTVRDTLKRLEEKYQSITLKSDNKATIITLLKWDTYQNGQRKTDNEPTSTRHQPDTKQEGNKVNKVNNREGALPNNLDEVKAFFKNNLEAESFYDHFQSNGWKVGGKTPMRDWQAAARNWQRRQSEFTKNNNPQNLSKGQLRTAESMKSFIKRREYEKANGGKTLPFGYEDAPIALPDKGV